MAEAETSQAEAQLQDADESRARVARSRKGKKRKRRKRTTGKSGLNHAAKRRRTVRPFPAGTFEFAIELPRAILRFAPGGSIRRLTLFDELKRSPDSSASRQLITVSNAYGLTTGGYQAEHLQVTDDGRASVSAEAGPGDRIRARFRCAIERVEHFRMLFDGYSGQKLPSRAVLRDFLVEREVAEEWIPECIDTFIANCGFVGLLKTVAGAERLLSIDHAVEEAGKGAVDDPDREVVIQKGTVATAPSAPSSDEWDAVCFYITPIGDDGSEERQHADLFMESLIEPAMEPLGLRVVRADQIGDPGMITSQVLEYLTKSRLAIADLSFSNPNVFYEMALRHARRLPVVQIKRRKDRLPFDVNQVRTVVVDTSDIYTLVPKLEVIKSDITTQARAAIENPENVGNPISVFFPQFFAYMEGAVRA